jgi:hypothetical protein
MVVNNLSVELIYNICRLTAHDRHATFSREVPTFDWRENAVDLPNLDYVLMMRNTVHLYPGSRAPIG